MGSKVPIPSIYVEVFLLALLLLMDTCDAPPCPNTYIHTFNEGIGR
jgi:hypothetical protein